MNQTKQDTTIDGYFKAGKILFGAFILGVINFGIVITVLFFMDVLPLVEFAPELMIYFIAGSIIFFLLMTYLGSLIFNKKIAKVKSSHDFAKKLAVYREGKLIQAVTLEAAALLAMVFVMLNTHIIFVVIAALSLLQMIRVFPKKAEMIEVLDLSYSEQQNLNNPVYDLR
jgi:voltage-gated potassium channel Kch